MEWPCNFLYPLAAVTVQFPHSGTNEGLGYLILFYNLCLGNPMKWDGILN